ncbi:MAG TPA: ABC transporter substrate-binding protein [Xanthobacteraceae bacterium]|nr:ABC transporter substrate-binding protein [Xanthobacteraceae bacterium]
MLNRRQFNLLAASTGLTLLTVGETDAQGVRQIRMANAAGVVDPQLMFATVGQNKRLNYYAQEGVSLEVVNMSGSAQTLQAIASGNSETANISPIFFLPLLAKDPDIDIINVYAWLRVPSQGIAVKPDSPVKTIADLKGKTIGIRNQGDSGYPFARAMLKELGINPDKDVEWVPIGEGGPAGQAIYRGAVAAMAFWDGSFARIENAGYPLRMLENTPGMKKLNGSMYGVRKSDLAKNRDHYVRYFRAMAKSTIFAVTNPELSVKLHWEVYPETKPKGKTDAEALKEALHVVNARKAKWLAAPWQKDKRMGAMDLGEWEAQVEFAGLAGKIDRKMLESCFTNDLIDEINAFDAGAVRAAAKSMVL